MGCFYLYFHLVFLLFFCQFHMISGHRKENISTSHAIYHENWSNRPFMNILWPSLKTLHSGRKTPVIWGRIRLPGAYCISVLLISVQKVQHKHLNAYCLSSAFIKQTVKYASQNGVVLTLLILTYDLMTGLFDSSQRQWKCLF